MSGQFSIDRRGMLLGGTLGAAGFGRSARAADPAAFTPEVLRGDAITLRIGAGHVRMGGRFARGVAINGSVPGPTLRLRQGQMLRLTVINELDEPTALHWHGLILPWRMDGVPGVSFAGIPARSQVTYEFPITQAGTYWYHSHAGWQEMQGCYGALVIDPAGEADEAADHVLLLSDHSFDHPAHILANLKADPGYYNRAPLSLADGAMTVGERLRWARMRMDPTDIADVTGAAMRYLVNGNDAQANWTALFAPGQAVRLRLINGAAMTYFNVRIPGLAMDVVAADGQPVRPVTVDEFQFGPGETYDVIVRPEARAYTIAAETMDRSGMARATLAPRPGMAAPVPPLRERPLLTMRDMGMDMPAMPGMSMDMSMRKGSRAPQVKLGPGVEMIAPMPTDRTGDPGIGLDRLDHRVLTYRDLASAAPGPDARAPEREITLHLTGAMERYMWSFDGRTMSEAHEPIMLQTGERVRMTLINDTMMAHPIHLHGHLFELVTGQGDHAPRKHTVTVLPGGKVSFDMTAQPGDWAFHCHLFLHMAMGMMRVVRAVPA